MSNTELILAADPPAEFHGDARELLRSVGSAETLSGTARLERSASFVRPKDAASLDVFLSRYTDEILIPVELPAVLDAWSFAEAGHARELIELDRELLRDERLKPFRDASCAVGRRQLSKLRPLRDQRVTQRYWKAMDNGEAAAWHTLVFGVMTSVYSIPVRQALAQLAGQTLGGFAFSAAGDYQLRLDDCRTVVAEQAERLPERINRLIQEDSRHKQPLFAAV